jgi:hypothetical protein
VAEFGEASLAQVRVAAQSQIDVLHVGETLAQIFSQNAVTTIPNPSSTELNDEVLNNVSQLVRLERYEMRALSRREKAARALDKDCTQRSRSH